VRVLCVLLAFLFQDYGCDDMDDSALESFESWRERRRSRGVAERGWFSCTLHIERASSRSMDLTPSLEWTLLWAD